MEKVRITTPLDEYDFDFKGELIKHGYTKQVCMANAAELTEPAFDKMYSPNNFWGVMLFSKGFTGGNNEVVYQNRIKGRDVRIDFEKPTGSSSGNVHIHIDGDKIWINSMEDIEKLPKSIRKNAVIVKGLKKALQKLTKFL